VYHSRRTRREFIEMRYIVGRRFNPKSKSELQESNGRKKAASKGKNRGWDENT